MSKRIKNGINNILVLVCAVLVISGCSGSISSNDKSTEKSSAATSEKTGDFENSELKSFADGILKKYYPSCELPSLDDCHYAGSEYRYKIKGYFKIDSASNKTLFEILIHFEKDLQHYHLLYLYADNKVVYEDKLYHELYSATPYPAEGEPIDNTPEGGISELMLKQKFDAAIDRYYPDATHAPNDVPSDYKDYSFNLEGNYRCKAVCPYLLNGEKKWGTAYIQLTEKHKDGYLLYLEDETGLLYQSPMLDKISPDEPFPADAETIHDIGDVAYITNARIKNCAEQILTAYYPDCICPPLYSDYEYIAEHYACTITGRFMLNPERVISTFRIEVHFHEPPSRSELVSFSVDDIKIVDRPDYWNDKSKSDPRT